MVGRAKSRKGVNVSFCDNINLPLLSVLNEALKHSSDVQFAVAFLKVSGLKLIITELENVLQRGGVVELLVGLDFNNTEPQALRKLREMGDVYEHIKCYCFSDYRNNLAPTYHPKLYLMNNSSDAIAVVGSSNITAGGLNKNIEANIVLKGAMTEEIFSEVYSIYERLMSQTSIFTPNTEYLAIYEEAYSLTQRHQKSARAELKREGIIKQAVEIEKELPAPEWVPRLVGWLKAVYDRIPDGSFKPANLYEYEDEFQNIYPENRHIQAKIRQSLQFLRNRGLLRQTKPGTWEKA